MTLPPARRSCSVGLAIGVVVGSVAACLPLKDDETRQQARVDTITVTDTVVRVDTVVVLDTVIALGDVADTGSTAAHGPRRASLPPRLQDSTVTAVDLAYLRSRRLLVPVVGVAPREILDSFDDMRGARRHNALDIPAARGTPVVASDSGTILKLHSSSAGGRGIYAADRSRRFVYYYAHLDRYRAGLLEGQHVRRGDTIGFVGTTGNAPPNLPHLHFAIARMDPDGSWWKGTPIDPLTLLTAPAQARPATRER